MERIFRVLVAFIVLSLIQVRPVHRQVAAHLRGVARHRPARPHGGALPRPGSVSQSLGNTSMFTIFPKKCLRKLLTRFDFSPQSSSAIGRRKPGKETLHVSRLFFEKHTKTTVCVLRTRASPSSVEEFMTRCPTRTTPRDSHTST